MIVFLESSIYSLDYSRAATELQIGESCGSYMSLVMVEYERRESILFVIVFYARKHFFFQSDINSNRLYITYNRSDSEKMRL